MSAFLVMFLRIDSFYQAEGSVTWVVLVSLMGTILEPLLTEQVQYQFDDHE